MELLDILDENGNKIGKTIVRGKSLRQGEYIRIVHVWIKNNKEEFLITKRSANKKYLPNMWETTVGAVISGENSFDAALREVKEEISFDLSPKSGKYLFTSKGQYQTFIDVWLFQQELDIKEVICQQEEVCGVKWATPSEIQSSIESGEFADTFTYLEELFKVK